MVDAQYCLIILRLKACVYECNTKRKNWGSILDSARVQKNESSDKESNQKAKTLSTAEMWSLSAYKEEVECKTSCRYSKTFGPQAASYFR